MKARNWLFLASFLLMLKGAMDISIYFVQYLSLGLRYIPTAPAQMHRANVLCIIYGSYGVCLLIVGILGVIFRENPRRLRFLMTTGLILFGLGFFTGMVNYLVLLWDGHRCCVQCDHECPVTGNVYPYYLYRKTGICGRSEIRGYR